MKKILLLALIVILGILISRHVRAQAAGAPWQVAVSGFHTACTTTASTTQFCFAADGLWQSINGSAYVQIGTLGPIGAPVTSVNGKTGAVTLVIQ